MAERLTELHRLFPQLNPRTWEQLEIFAVLLEDPVMSRGLTGFAREALPREIGRSLLLLGLGKPAAYADVGSGAGFPGIPLAAAWGVGDLIEPRRRAVGFLERVAREAQLDLRIHQVEANTAARTLGAKFDLVTARALASPARSIGLIGPLCAPGGRAVITGTPGSRLPQEAIDAAGELGLSPPETADLEATDSMDSGRSLAIAARVHIMSKT